MFAKKSKANSSVEKRRRLISEEEQDLLLDGPGLCAMPSISTWNEGGNKEDMQQLAVNHVLDTGLCHFPALLTAHDRILLKEHIDRILTTAKNNVGTKGFSFLSHFGPVMARTHRYDVLLPLDHLVLPPVRKVLSNVEEIMRAIVGEEAYLCELSALISDPLAVAQPIHHDTSFDGTPPRVSLLVALQDIDSAMGPTYFFPNTNSPEWHLKYMMRDEDLEELLSSHPFCAGNMKAGDAVLYDTTLLHCASSAEHSERRRTLLTLSAQEENTMNANEQANIKPGYRSSLQLNQLKEWKEKD